MLATSLNACGKGGARQNVAVSPDGGGSEANGDVDSDLVNRTPAIDPGFGGDDEPEGGGVELNDPEPADPAEDVLNAVIRQITHPFTGETFDIVDGRVSIAFANPPLIPEMDENYFDVPRIQVDPYYSIQYPLLVGDPAIDAFIAAENLDVMSEWRAHKILGVALPPETSVEQAILTWPALYPGLVESVEPDSISYADAWPQSDPNEERLYNHWSVIEWALSGDYDIGAQTAWRGGKTGSSDVVVAVMDTGVQRMHPDLISRLTEWGVNTFPRLCKIKINRWYGEPWPSLLAASAANAIGLGHGTCVAGVVGAGVDNDPDFVNNDTDAAGVTAYCKILPIAISANSNAEGVPLFDVFAIYNAFYALGAFKGELDRWQLWPDNLYPHYNIEVVNCSFGGPSTSPHYISIVNTIMPYTLIVGSAGNQNSATNANWPGACDRGLSVAGYTSDGLRWYVSQNVGSNWNPAVVDIAGPTRNIVTTDMFGSDHGHPLGYDPTSGYYANFSGTSAAAPHVSAVAALLASHTSMSTSQIRSQIIVYRQALNPMEFQLTCGGVDAALVFGLPHP